MPSDFALAIPYLDAAVQAAAEATKPFVGCGDKVATDTAAVECLRAQLNRAPIRGTIIIGEGEADESAFLYNGERVGAGWLDASGPEIDIAVDPVDGTTAAAGGGLNAVCMLGASPKGTMLGAPDIKMQKIITQPKLNPDNYTLDMSWEEIFERAAKELEKTPSQLRVAYYGNEERYPVDYCRDKTLRPAFEALEIQPLQLPNEWPQIEGVCAGRIDLLVGIGGAPEAIASTAALIQAGAHIQGRFYVDEADLARFGTFDTQTIFKTKDIINSDETHFAIAPITPLISIPWT